MCHHPASASAGMAADDAQAGSGTGAAARTWSTSACNPETVRWVHQCRGVKDFGGIPPTLQCIAQTLRVAARSRRIGMLDVVQQDRVAQQNGGKDAAPLQIALLRD